MQNILKHVVGRSTLKEGFAIPRDFEDWMSAPERGKRRDIVLFFNGQRISAVLRRIGNEKGSAQIKYENIVGEPFRNWLAKTFATSHPGKNCGFFEVHRVAKDTYEIIPFPEISSSVSSLNIEQWLFHRGADKLLAMDSPLAEVPAIVHTVSFNPQEGQSFYKG